MKGFPQVMIMERNGSKEVRSVLLRTLNQTKNRESEYIEDFQTSQNKRLIWAGKASEVRGRNL